MYTIFVSSRAAPFAAYAAAARAQQDAGGRSEMVELVRPGAPNPAGGGGTGVPVTTVRLPEAAPDAPGNAAVLAQVAARLAAADPAVILQCDVRDPFTAGLTQKLREVGYRGVIVGGQGGLADPRPEVLAVDRLLCFGARQVARLRAEHQVSAQAAGLPALDRWRDAAVSRRGYGVFLAHGTPEAPIIDAALAAFEGAIRMPIVVCGHPDFPGLYRHQPRTPGGRLPGGSADDLLAHCDFVLATDATAIADAWYLDKPVVLLPNAGLAVFDRYPGIAEGFGPAALLAALRRVMQEPGCAQPWLEELVGGRRYDHAGQVCAALARLAGSGPLRPVEKRTPATDGVPGAGGSRLPKLMTRAELAAFLPTGGAAAELGVAKGAFSAELLQSREDFRLYSIDRWAGDRGHNEEEYGEACALLGGFGERSTIVRKSFDEALADFEPESLDLIYIDGYAHDGQEGGRTLESWWSRLKVGGIFAGHDYHPDWPATMAAVDAFCAAHGLGVQTTSGDYFPSWYVRKPRAGLARA